MKAIVLEAYGPAENLKLQEVDKPTPKSDEVLIKVYASCINDWDWHLVTGASLLDRLIGGGIFKPKIKILGCDVAGVVEEVGDDVKELKIGDKVFGDLSGGRWGGFAEYTCAREDELALMATNMSFEEAAAIPQSGCLALQALRMGGSTSSNKNILINGAGGGVGTFGIQLIKMEGGDVTGVDSEAKLELMRSLGADQVIDYHKEDFTKIGEKYDLIIDNMVNRKASDFKKAISPNGVLAMLGGNVPRLFRIGLWSFLGKLMPWKKGGRMKILAYKVSSADLSYLAKLCETGKLKSILDGKYLLADTPKAMKRYGERKGLGKVVITVRES